MSRAAPCSHAGQMRQHDAADFVDQCIGILPAHQLALLFHQAQLQHFGLDLDVIGVGLRARRTPMLRAQVLDVAQPRCGLVVTAIAALLDHRFRRQPRHVLPCAAKMRRQTVRGHDVVGHHADLVALRCRAFLRHHFGHRSILNGNGCRFATVRSGIARLDFTRTDVLTPCRRAVPPVTSVLL